MPICLLYCKTVN